MPYGDQLTQRLVNLLPYDLQIIHENGSFTTVHQSGNPVRISEQVQTRTMDFVNAGHVPIAEIKSGLSRIPDEREGIAYVVSLRALQLMREEGFDISDIYAPNSIIRDSRGKVIGAQRLMQLPARIDR